jgi:hypothetical protein
MSQREKSNAPEPPTYRDIPESIRGDYEKEIAYVQAMANEFDEGSQYRQAWDDLQMQIREQHARSRGLPI